jgi:hypothetical protein
LPILEVVGRLGGTLLHFDSEMLEGFATGPLFGADVGDVNVIADFGSSLTEL